MNSKWAVFVLGIAVYLFFHYRKSDETVKPFKTLRITDACEDYVKNEGKFTFGDARIISFDIGDIGVSGPFLQYSGLGWVPENCRIQKGITGLELQVFGNTRKNYRPPFLKVEFNDKVLIPLATQAEDDPDYINAFAGPVKFLLPEDADYMRKLNLVFPPSAQVGQVHIEVKWITERKRALPPVKIPPVQFDTEIMKKRYNFGEQKKKRMASLNQVLNYFQMTGPKPNASKKIKTEAGEFTVPYHIFQNKPSHIMDNGGTTSETLARYAMLLALAGSEKDFNKMLNYIRLYLIPNDGMESKQLPDSIFGNNSECLEDDNAKAPILMHWLISLGSGNNPPGFKENQLYDIFQNTQTVINYNDKGIPKISSYNNPYGDWKFSSAADADTWLVEALTMAYASGKSIDHQFGKKYAEGLRCLLNERSGGQKQLVMFNYTWGMKNGPWLSKGRFFYASYQNPALYYNLGMEETARLQSLLILDSQIQYGSLYGDNGPFCPSLATQNYWTFESRPDPNGGWAGFNFRTAANLAKYAFLSKDSASAEGSEKFFEWLKRKSKVSNGIITGLPGDWKEKEKFSIADIEPNSLGLVIQFLVWYKNFQTGQKKEEAEQYLRFALKGAENLLGKKPWLKGKDTYGYAMAELGIGLALVELYTDSKSETSTRAK